MMNTSPFRRVVSIGLLLLALPAIARGGEGPTPKPTSAQEPAAAPALEGEHDKSSYAVGMNLGGALRWQARDLDVDLVVRGFSDALAGQKTLLSPAEMRTILTRLQAGLQAKQQAEQADAAARAKAEGEAFLAANKSRDGVVALESGLQYKVLKGGEGPKPTLEDTVVCHYRGTLLDGTEFDSTFARSAPATLAVKGVVKGWAEALQLMPTGSRWQLFLPASLAYGERGAGDGIGPNATLVFEVELLSIAGASETASLAPQDAGPAALAGINVSFKLDPRITKGLYMGERWVPMPYLQLGAGAEVTVDARAEGIDANGKAMRISPQWIPADPEVATVTPSHGDEVRITALRPGESGLRVVSAGVSKNLAVRAAYRGEVLQVEITQP